MNIMHLLSAYVALVTFLFTSSAKQTFKLDIKLGGEIIEVNESESPYHNAFHTSKSHNRLIKLNEFQMGTDTKLLDDQYNNTFEIDTDNSTWNDAQMRSMLDELGRLKQDNYIAYLRSINDIVKTLHIKDTEVGESDLKTIIEEEKESIRNNLVESEDTDELQIKVLRQQKDMLVKLLRRMDDMQDNTYDEFDMLMREANANKLNANDTKSASDGKTDHKQATGDKGDDSPHTLVPRETVLDEAKLTNATNTKTASDGETDHEQSGDKDDDSPHTLVPTETVLDETNVRQTLMKDPLVQRVLKIYAEKNKGRLINI